MGQILVAFQQPGARPAFPAPDSKECQLGVNLPVMQNPQAFVFLKNVFQKRFFKNALKKRFPKNLKKERFFEKRFF